MSQKVKVFRSNNPLLSVLMWGVSHSVSMNFAFLWMQNLDSNTECVCKMLFCRSMNYRMLIILLCWCLMTSKHSPKCAWITISSTSECSIMNSLQCYFHVMSYFFITICREGVVYLLCRWLQLEADVSRGVLTFVELNPDENRKNLVSFRFNVAFVTMCSLDFYRGQFHPRWSLLVYSFDK